MYLIKNYSCYRIAFWSSFNLIDTSTSSCDVCLFVFCVYLFHFVSRISHSHSELHYDAGIRWMLWLQYRCVCVCSTSAGRCWRFLINYKVFCNISNWSNAIDQIGTKDIISLVFVRLSPFRIIRPRSVHNAPHFVRLINTYQRFNVSKSERMREIQPNWKHIRGISFQCPTSTWLLWMFFSDRREQFCHLNEDAPLLNVFQLLNLKPSIIFNVCAAKVFIIKMQLKRFDMFYCVLAMRIH